MKHITPTILAAASLALAAPTGQAQETGFYLRAFGSASQLNDTATTGIAATQSDFSSGLATGGAVGWSLPNRPLRIEGEYVYRTGDANGTLAGDFASTTVFVNGLYDFPVGGKIQPYAGVGLGYVTEIDWDVDAGPAAGEYTSRGGTAFQLIVGVQYDITDSFALTAEIRRVDAGRQEMTRSDGQTLTADYVTQDVALGIAFRF